MAHDALKAAASGGSSLKPMDQLKLKVDSIQKQLHAAIPQSMAKHLTADRLTRLFWQEVRRVPQLAQCEPTTIAMGLMSAAQLGIEIGVLGQGYLIPFRNTKRGGRYEAQFIVGYKGLIALARRSGEVVSIETHIVYMNDKFKMQIGLDTNVDFEPKLDGERGDPRLVFGVAKFKDGGHHFEWMSWLDIMKVKARSKAGSSGPWVTDVEQMARKTLIRRMSNYLPLSIEFASALSIDDAIDAGKHASIDADFTVETDEESDLTGADGAPPALENNPGETVPAMGAKQGEKMAAPAGQAKPRADTKDQKSSDAPPPAVKPPSYALVSELINKARTDEEFEAVRIEIERVQDGKQQIELQDLLNTRIDFVKNAPPPAE